MNIRNILKSSTLFNLQNHCGMGVPLSTYFPDKEKKSYLPGGGETMITKMVFPGLGLSIALLRC